MGCRTVNESTVAGTYRLRTPCVTATVVLNRDHTFSQSVQTSSGQTKQLKGEWRLTGADNKGIIGHLIAPFSKFVDLEPFLDLSHDARGEVVPGMSPTAETLGLSVSIGPIMVQCSNSEYKADYNK